MQITIIDDSQNRQCSAGCGIDWSSSEAVTLACQRIEERFGQEVELRYMDLARTTADPDASAWRESIKEKNLLLPLLLLNGQLRISGDFDIRQLIDVIEVEIEIGERT